MKYPKKYVLPTIKYIDENRGKKMASFRLPIPLLERLEELAYEKRLDVTMIVTLVLDQFLQLEDANLEDKKKDKK
ncbi:MAG: hypothetical protein HQK51_17645 [Oligoflexia bacterium]|nr:hypothetical protein [Oligoflexia bacterium]